LIELIDNDIFEGNKLINVVLQSNSQNYQFGAIASNALTIIDDEHPLKNWIGTYSVEALSYGNPGSWDEAWTVTTSAVDGDVESLAMVMNTGGGAGTTFLGTFNTDEMTITFAPGTDVGNVYGYGPTLMYVGDFSYLDDVSSVVGTIDDDGTIMIDELAMFLPDLYANGYYWDAFNTTWTKTGKKATSVGEGFASKLARLK
jgi:hypothetical protein